MTLGESAPYFNISAHYPECFLADLSKLDDQQESPGVMDLRRCQLD